MSDYKYEYTDFCWFKGNCTDESEVGCSSLCSRRSEFDYLINNSGIPDGMLDKQILYPESIDLPIFEELGNIKNNIESFVEDGEFLYLWSKKTGNSKSSWVIKMLKTYLAMIHIGNNFKDRAYFVYTPSLLLLSKQFDNPEREKLLKKLLTVDLVVLDDIGAVASGNYDKTIISDIVNTRYNNKLCTLFTSNLSDEDLAKSLDARIADRVLSGIVLKLQGSSRRESRTSYTPKGAKG